MVEGPAPIPGGSPSSGICMLPGRILTKVRAHSANLRDIETHLDLYPGSDSLQVVVESLDCSNAIGFLHPDKTPNTAVTYVVSARTVVCKLQRN